MFNSDQVFQNYSPQYTRSHIWFILLKQILQDFYYISFSDNSLGIEGAKAIAEGVA